MAAITSSIPLPPPLKLTGSIIQNWKTFKSMWLNYEIATDLLAKDTGIRTATLLSCIGIEGFQLYQSLDFAEDADRTNVDRVLERLERHCTGEVNETLERFKFNQRSQESSENIDMYVSALRILVKVCNFGTQEDSLMRDRLVMGIRDDTTRNKLLQTRDLDLRKTVDICRASEVSSKQCGMAANSSVLPQHQPFLVQHEQQSILTQPQMNMQQLYLQSYPPQHQGIYPDHASQHSINQHVQHNQSYVPQQMSQVVPGPTSTNQTSIYPTPSAQAVPIIQYLQMPQLLQQQQLQQLQPQPQPVPAHIQMQPQMLQIQQQMRQAPAVSSYLGLGKDSSQWQLAPPAPRQASVDKGYNLAHPVFIPGMQQPGQPQLQLHQTVVSGVAVENSMGKLKNNPHAITKPNSNEAVVLSTSRSASPKNSSDEAYNQVFQSHFGSFVLARPPNPEVTSKTTSTEALLFKPDVKSLKTTALTATAKTTQVSSLFTIWPRWPVSGDVGRASPVMEHVEAVKSSYKEVNEIEGQDECEVNCEDTTALPQQTVASSCAPEIEIEACDKTDAGLTCELMQSNNVFATAAVTEDSIAVILPTSDSHNEKHLDIMGHCVSAKEVASEITSADGSSTALTALDGESVVEDSAVQNIAVVDEAKLKYKEGQWSPLNPTGSKKYDSAFLREIGKQMKNCSKPKDLADFPNIFPYSVSKQF